MNKEIRDLMAKIENARKEGRELFANGKKEEAKAKAEEVKTMENDLSIMIDLFEQEKEVIKDKEVEKPKNENVVKEFINGVRNKFKNAMTSGSNEDGGYTVPQDIKTQINELRERKDALQMLVTVEKVTAPTGSRIFKTRSQQSGFVEVLESGDIPEKATPKFTQLQYAVKKYAGFFKMTNELLKDSDAAIRQALINWIGHESRVTRNKLILAALGTKAKTAIANPDDIKDTLNVTLDPAFRYTSTIVTNQDGFNWLDKLKDNDGNYLLQPSVAAPTGKQIFGVPITMVSNKDLPTVTGKAPMIIGDLKEAVILFDREDMSIAVSDSAEGAFLTDMTLFRVIEREEVKIKDDEAFVYGEITI